MTAAYPEFRQTRCTRYRFRYSECRRCADACPHDAIGLSDDGASVDVARCQNCGLCSSACRTGAWDAGNMPRVELLKQAIKAPQWSFACAPSGADADAVVPCLGAIDATMLAYLCKRGIRVELRGAEHCIACAHGAQGAPQIAANLEAATILHEAAGDAWTAVTVVASSPENPARPVAFVPGRRQLFRRLLGRAATEIQHAADPVVVPEPIPDKAIRAARALVTEQRELLQIIAKTGERAPFRVREHEALPLMRLALAEGCTSCEACFRACPTGALQVRESETAWSLGFRVDLCVACEVCLEVCQPRVLHPVSEFDIAPGAAEDVLRALNKQRCRRCDRAFVSPAPTELCAICVDDETAFDTVFG